MGLRQLGPCLLIKKINEGETMLKGFMALSLFAQGLLEKLQSLKPTITKTSVEVPSKKIIIKKATLDQVP